MTVHIAEMSAKELRNLASKLKIVGRSKMKKAALIAAVTAAMGEPEPATAAQIPKISPPPVGNPEPTPQLAPVPVAEPAPAPVHPAAGKGPLLPPLNLPDAPTHYDDSFLSLLPKTPGSLVCVWSLGNAERRALVGRPLELRIIDQTWDHRVVHRANPDLDARHWAVSGLTPDRTYRALLGSIQSGEFVAVLWSRALPLPPTRPRPWRVEDVVWTDGVRTQSHGGTWRTGTATSSPDLPWGGSPVGTRR